MDNFEECYDCGELNISRKDVGAGNYECTCRSCGAKWIDSIQDD